MTKIMMVHDRTHDKMFKNIAGERRKIVESC